MSCVNDFASAVSKLKKAARRRPRPQRGDEFFYQDADSDFVQFFERRDAYYAEYVDERLTVYYGRTDNKIIGAKISQVSKLIENAPGIRLEVRDGRVSLNVLFMASRLTADTKLEEFTPMLYEKVKSVQAITERFGADVEFA